MIDSESSFEIGKIYGETQHLGSLSIFVNLPKQVEYSTPDSVIAAIESQVGLQFERNLKQEGLHDVISIQGVRSEKGCLIVHLDIGLWIAAAWGFFGTYKSVEEGVLLAARRIKQISVFLSDREYVKGSFLMDHRLEVPERIEPTVDGGGREI